MFLTIKTVGCHTGSMLDIEVFEDPAAAGGLAGPDPYPHPADELAEPGSDHAARREGGLPRQKVNYHLKALERHGWSSSSRSGGAATSPNASCARRARRT